MHKLLSDWMGKLGISTVSEMSNEEKETFDRWKPILDGEHLTIEKVVEFCKRQKNEIESEFGNLNNPSSKNDKLVLLHSVWSKIIMMLEAQEQERLALERQLEQMLDTDNQSQL